MVNISATICPTYKVSGKDNLFNSLGSGSGGDCVLGSLIRLAYFEICPQGRFYLKKKTSSLSWPVAHEICVPGLKHETKTSVIQRPNSMVIILTMFNAK